VVFAELVLDVRKVHATASTHFQHLRKGHLPAKLPLDEYVATFQEVAYDRIALVYLVFIMLQVLCAPAVPIVSTDTRW
jgi:hypothetical protein